MRETEGLGQSVCGDRASGKVGVFSLSVFFSILAVIPDRWAAGFELEEIFSWSQMHPAT